MQRHLHGRLIGLLSGLLLCIVTMAGCGSEADLGPPIRREDAERIKSGMSLTEIEAILGPSRTATSVERKRLDEIAEKMPARARDSLTGNETDLGWGNSNASLAARFNAEQRSFIVSWHVGDGPPPGSAGGPPQPPEAPKVHFRDMSKPGGSSPGK